EIDRKEQDRRMVEIRESDLEDGEKRALLTVCQKEVDDIYMKAQQREERNLFSARFGMLFRDALAWKAAAQSNGDDIVEATDVEILTETMRRCFLCPLKTLGCQRNDAVAPPPGAEDTEGGVSSDAAAGCE